MVKYVYGPVPSRRLGRSLGVDLLPLKTCNWNCIYCQLGRTIPLTAERREYVPSEAVLAELKEAMAGHAPGAIDWIAFAGSGEPTLHLGLGWLIKQIREFTAVPVAVVTNGSLLYRPDIRLELSLADAVMPTLSAGSAELHRDIHRPYPEATFTRHVAGLIAFRREYAGQLWVEVMLLHGLNDTEAALRDLADVIARIQPDAVHLVLPTRPPAETWVQPADEEGIMRATAILGDIAQVVHPAQGEVDLSGCDDVSDAILDIIARHPLPQEELEHALARWSAGSVSDALTALARSGRAQVVERYGVSFWSAGPAAYPDQAQSERVSPAGRRRRKSAQPAT